ncbi:MAG: TonB-dependent receptor [Acidobacteriaceae bacterium]|nr:TonB-dependent receptor [Acidobacteriaceae bacterium]
MHWLRGARVPLLAALLWPFFLNAQHPTGEIRLEVKDQSGAVMQISGTLQDLASGTIRRFQTDSEGRAALTKLPYARYRVQVSREGFVQQTMLIEVKTASPISRTVTMKLGTSATSLEVVASTPLPGADVTSQQIAAPVQTLSAHDVEQSGALDLSDLLNRRLNAVNVNENQENPFQPDINYRGYTASPLLGTPQGISVYLDGVRLNQPFGDVVSWDLIPTIAISELALIPGSNPLFGLNTLGGALSIDTKDGHTQPGTSIQVSGGSFGRRAVEAEHGGFTNKGLSWYFAGNLFHEDGWRPASPSDVRQLFAKGGWQRANTAVSLSFAYADNTLIGNGLQETRLLAQHYSSVYTKGDVTSNRSPFFNLALRHAASSSLTFSGNAYFRYIRADNVNTNLNNDALDENLYQPNAADRAALTAAGFTGFPTSGATALNTPFPKWRCIAQAIRLADPSDLCDGIFVNGFTKQNNYGLAGQTTWTTSRAGHRNQLTAGAGWDRSGVTFQQSAQFAYVNPDYTFTPVNAFEDGSTSNDQGPVDTRVNLHGVPQTWSVYATDIFSLTSAWNFVVSGRYNRTTIDNRDRLNPGGGPGSLDGNYVFGRLNPAIGVTYSPRNSLTAYASYSEGSRAPTAIELGCADPNNPCSLPNAVTSDPPLRQVVTRTVEAGVRGRSETRLNWSAGWFFAQNHDDILFVASTQTNNGYFKNFGETRRQGVEVHAGGRMGRLTLNGNYTFVDATYRSSETLSGSSNSTSDTAMAGDPGMDGVIQVVPGDRIPLIPHHILKTFADVQITEKLSGELEFLAASQSYARGNENNLQSPDGTYYLGSGISPGYGVLNLAAHYQLQKHVHLSVEMNNLLNHRYYTAAQLAVTGFSAQGTVLARPFPAVNGNYPLVNSTFYAPGAPFGVWGAIRFLF